MIGMREILRIFANISRSDIVGMRAPFLKPGRNTQYKARKFYNFSLIHLSYIIILLGLGRLWLHL